MIENRNITEFFHYFSIPALQYSSINPVLRGNVSGMLGSPTDCNEEIT